MSNDNYKKIISKRIVELRRNHSLTQQQFAEKIGVSKQTVSNWENAIKFPRMELLEKIAQIFNVNKSDLISDEDHFFKDVQVQVLFRSHTKDLKEEDIEELQEDIEDYLQYRLKRIRKRKNL